MTFAIFISLLMNTFIHHASQTVYMTNSKRNGNYRGGENARPFISLNISSDVRE